MEEHQADPARPTRHSEGKAIGSADHSSSSLLPTLAQAHESTTNMRDGSSGEGVSGVATASKDSKGSAR